MEKNNTLMIPSDNVVQAASEMTKRRIPGKIQAREAEKPSHFPSILQQPLLILIQRGWALSTICE